MTELIGQIVDGYEILRMVGSGGMSAVYEARDPITGKRVAIKLLAAVLATDPNFLARFRREVELLQGFDHPNIVRILKHGELQGAPYLIMPFMESGTLQERLRGSPLGVREAAKLMDDLAGALQYAHDRGVVHRDIKPSNILIDAQGNALLTDFGIARWREASLSLTGSALVGTPAFMSPEQCLGEEVDARSDQYALGIVMYRVAAGKLPFDGDTPLAVALKQINESLPPLREANPSIPVEVAEVLERALAKKPKDRYKSVAEFNRHFQRAIETYRLLSDQPTAIFPRLSRLKILADRRVRQLRRAFQSQFARRWPAYLGMLLLILAFPLGALALRGATAPSGETDPSPEPALRATIDALYALNASLMGNDMDADAVAAAVEATLQAMPGVSLTPTQPNLAVSVIKVLGFGSRGPTSMPTSELAGRGSWSEQAPTPTPTSQRPAPTTLPPTPTATLAYTSPTTEPDASPTAIGSPTAQPSSTAAPTTFPPPTFTPMPTATPSPTPLPSSSPTPPAMPTPIPTNTPKPTFTPEPTKHKCLPGKPPWHRFYCTPTPTSEPPEEQGHA